MAAGSKSDPVENRRSIKRKAESEPATKVAIKRKPVPITFSAGETSASASARPPSGVSLSVEHVLARREARFGKAKSDSSSISLGRNHVAASNEIDIELAV